MEQAEQKGKSEARLIKGLLLGCAFVALLVVGGCVALVFFLLRTASKVTEFSYEAPPSAEVSASYTHPEVIRLFLGLASPEEAAAIPPGSYHLTEGEINAYLNEKIEGPHETVHIRVKIDTESLLIYYSMDFLEKESAGSSEKTKKRKGFLPENLQASYLGRLKAVADNDGVRLEVVSFKMGKLPETALPPSHQPKMARRPFLPGATGAIPETDAQRIGRIIYEGVSYGAEVSAIELKPLQVRIQVEKVRTSPSP